MADQGIWKGLFEWSKRHNDGTAPSKVGPMLAERQRWLQEVIDDMTVDPIERMTIAVAALNCPEDGSQPAPDMRTKKRKAKDAEAAAAAAAAAAATTATTVSAADTSAVSKMNTNSIADGKQVDEKEQTEESKQALIHEIISKKEMALVELEDWVDSIDLAWDLFHSLNGFQPVVSLLSHPNPNLQWRAAQVLGTCVQNNPKCQEMAFKSAFLARLFRLLDPKSVAQTDSRVVKSALFALSSMIASHRPSEEAFLAMGGYGMLLALAAHDAVAVDVKRKVLKMLQRLWKKDARKKLPKESPIFATLTGMIGHDDIDLRESALRCLLYLCDQPSNLRQAKDPQLGTRAKVMARLSALQALTAQEDIDQVQDEVPLLQRLVEVLSV